MYRFRFLPVVIFQLVLIFCGQPPLEAATYYVSQSGAGDGSAVGTPDSVADFNANVFGELDGNTVYFLDTITTPITVPDGGTAGNLVTLRGDYSGQECTIDGAKDIRGSGTGDWLDQGGNIWEQDPAFVIGRSQLIIDGVIARYAEDEVPAAAGEWFYLATCDDAGHGTVCLQVYSTTNPYSAFTTMTIWDEDIGWGIKADGKDYVKIQGFTIQNIQSNTKDYTETAGAILIKDSDYVEVRNNTIDQCALGVNIVASSDYAIVDSNTVTSMYMYWNGGTYIHYAQSICSTGNNATISNNSINGNVVIYPDTTERRSEGIQLYTQDYPNYYSLNSKVYNNTVEYVGRMGVKVRQDDDNMGVQAVNIEIYGNLLRYSMVGGVEEDGIALGSKVGDATNYFTGVKIYNNWIDDFDNTNIIVANFWDEVEIYNNVLVNSRVAGMYLFNTVKVYNNTIAENYFEGIIHYGDNLSGAGVGSIITNNIIDNVDLNQAGHGKCIYITPAYDGNATGSNNVCYDIEGDPALLNFTNTDGVTTDPNLTSDYLIKLGSPAVNAGVDAGDTYREGLHKTAKWPNPRTTKRKGKWDIGAFVVEPKKKVIGIGPGVF